jgi:hypothetical protein
MVFLGSARGEFSLAQTRRRRTSIFQRAASLVDAIGNASLLIVEYASVRWRLSTENKRSYYRISSTSPSISTGKQRNRRRFHRRPSAFPWQRVLPILTSYSISPPPWPSGSFIAPSVSARTARELCRTIEGDYDMRTCQVATVGGSHTHTHTYHAHAHERNRLVRRKVQQRM